MLKWIVAEFYDLFAVTGRIYLVDIHGPVLSFKYDANHVVKLPGNCVG
jgi:hypothetical protein